MAILLTALCSGCATVANVFPPGLPLGQADLVIIKNNYISTTSTIEIRDTATIAKLTGFINALPNDWATPWDYQHGGQHYFEFLANGTNIGNFYIGPDGISQDYGGFCYQFVSQQQFETLGNIVGIDFRTHTYTPLPPPAADLISSSDTIAQAKAALQEFFVAWNTQDIARLGALVTSHMRPNFFPGLERIEVGNISMFYAKQDVVIFAVPTRLYYIDKRERTPPEEQALFFHYSVVREADGRWRISGF